MAVKIFCILATIFMNRNKAFSSPIVQPHLPFTPTYSHLINIVISSPLQHIPVRNYPQQDNLHHTYTVHTAKGLNFELSDDYLEQYNNSITINTGYLRLVAKHTNAQIVFLLLTNGNLIETVYAIKKSGFGTSDQVLFFNHVYSLNERNLLFITQFLKSLPKNNVKPFHANVVFFENEGNTVYVLCYFCNSKFAQLIPLQHSSFENLQKQALLLNSNGHGRPVQILTPFKETLLESLVDILYLTAPKYLPNKSCLQGFPSHKSGLEFLLSSISTCNYKQILGISSVQGVLNISIILHQNTNLHENKWHMQLQLTLPVFMKTDSFNVGNRRGYQVLNLEFPRQILTMAGCTYYNLYSTYDLSLFTMIEWQVWLAVAVTCCTIVFITADLLKGFPILSIWICLKVNLKNFDRRLRASVLLPITFIGFVHQSYISSDSTRLREFPNGFSVWLDNGFKLYSSKEEAYWWQILYNNFIPEFAKKDIEKTLNGYTPENYFTHEEVPTTNLSEMVKFMAQKKIGIMGAIEEHLVFTNFVSTSKILVDNTYTCLTIPSSNFTTHFLISLRATEYMSGRTRFVFSKWLETGEFQKVERLANNVYSGHKSLRYSNVIFLDKMAYPQPIDSKSIVGLSCFGVFVMGCTIYCIGFLLIFFKIVKRKILQVVTALTQFIMHFQLHYFF